MAAYTTQDLEILIATVDRTDLGFLKPMFGKAAAAIPYRLLIVNQSKTSELNSSFNHIKVINSREYGLSRSRNLAIENATGTIALIADDDVVYKDDFADAIVAEYNESPDAMVFIFKVSDGGELRNYPPSAKSLLIDEIESVSSIEITFKTKRLKNSKVRFDERFGLGTDLPLGEEFLFMRAALKAGSVYQSDHLICYHADSSSGKNPVSPNHIRARAAINHVTGFWPDLLWRLKYALWLKRNGYIELSDFAKVFTEAKRGVEILKSSRS